MDLLAINWSEVGIKAAQFVLSFSIIVVLHELGHFIPARLFKCRVEKFYLFFNPWFSLWKKKIGETEWGIGWIPFGGYVKIAGMIDESMDKEAMKQPPQSWEFRSKPAWQRLIIMVGGVAVNLVLGFIIYAMMMWYWGDRYIPTDNLTYGIGTDSLAQSIGLRDGDQIVSLDGQKVEKFRMIPLTVILKGTSNIEVNRNGETVNVTVPEDFAGKLIRHKAVTFIEPRFPFVGVDTVLKGGQADKAGLQKNDVILSYNGKPVRFYSDFRTDLRGLKNQPIQMVVKRGNDTVQIQAAVSKDGKLGLGPKFPTEPYYQEKTIRYSFLEAFPAAYGKSIETLESYWLQLKLIFSGKVKTSESLGSVFSIANMFSGQWDWQSFWNMTAFFSLVLALMNILPIPALDGGHALFTIIEIITRRKPNEKVIEYAQMAGMVLLLGLMAYALGLDIFRIFK
jgi:regulator of sigma E protease